MKRGRIIRKAHLPTTPVLALAPYTPKATTVMTAAVLASFCWSVMKSRRPSPIVEEASLMTMKEWDTCQWLI